MQYDVVIIGAGSAGAILATRLSEDPQRSVLLLEAGPDYPHFEQLPAAVPGEPLSDVISICYILGFRKDNTKFFNKLSLNRRHF